MRKKWEAKRGGEREVITFHLIHEKQHQGIVVRLQGITMGKNHKNEKR